MQNPSWSEIRHFVKFLNIQLDSCEKSVYLTKTVPKLKTFVVKFLIRMSTVRLGAIKPARMQLPRMNFLYSWSHQDFATSSLSGEVALEENEDLEDKDEIDKLQIIPRNQWEQRYFMHW